MTKLSDDTVVLREKMVGVNCWVFTRYISLLRSVLLYLAVAVILIFYAVTNICTLIS